MRVRLLLPAVLYGQRFRAGTTLAVAPHLEHLARQLVAAGAAEAVFGAGYAG